MLQYCSYCYTRRWACGVPLRSRNQTYDHIYDEHSKSVYIFWKLFSSRLPSPCSLRKRNESKIRTNPKLKTIVLNVKIALNFQCWNYIVMKFRMLTLCVEFSNVNIYLCYFDALPWNIAFEKNWGYNRATVCSIIRKILECDMKSRYKNISKIRNVTFIFQNF